MSEQLDLQMCSDCQHWHREGERVGFCDRFPPTIVLPAAQTQQFPRVLSNDHCAEWSVSELEK